MIELREPPSRDPGRGDATLWLGVVQIVLLLLLGLGVWSLLRAGSRTADQERQREVASRLQAAGLVDQAAEVYSRHLTAGPFASPDRARLAAALGESFFERGAFGEAVRWFYEAESLDPDGIGSTVAPRIVAALERLGRSALARQVLAERSQLTAGESSAAEDVVVARIGARAITRSEVDGAIDALPPAQRQAVSKTAGREALLRRLVADELLWRKAQRLGYADDPEVRALLERSLKQVVVGRFVEREVLAKIEPSESDLQNYFAVHRDRYAAADGAPADGGEGDAFARFRPQVERDYRLERLQSELDSMVDAEVQGSEVELFPQRLEDS